MKKHMMMLVALLVAITVAAPAFAAVEFKYGGQFRARWISQDNWDGNDNVDDNRNFFDQRLRLYFTFIGSQNLKVVTKFEVGDTVWGDDTVGRFGTGGRVGADAVAVEIKNAYIEFNIPCTPTTATIGIQGINMMNSWLVDDDFSAAVFKSKFDPVVVTVGYIAGQVVNVTDPALNVDSFFLSLDYANGPLNASLIGYYQYGHNTLVSVDPATTATTPLSATNGTAVIDQIPHFNPASAFFGGPVAAFDNNLFDLGLTVNYKLDWMSAYAMFIKNLGGVDLDFGAGKDSEDYTGWMVDAGANFFYGPYTFNIGGFYTSGPELNDNGTLGGSDVDWFVYPLATTKYFSEIMGGGILDNNAPARGNEGNFWRGYGQPSNIWTVTAGAAWQVLEKTKLSGSYWYFGTSEDVISGIHNRRFTFDDSLGHELDFYITQGIVDGLVLDIVGAYMIAEDAYTVNNEDDNAYEVGARIQWNF